MAARETSRPYLQVVASQGLVRLGSTEYICTLVEMLGRYRHEIQDTIPSYLVDLARTHPDVVAACLRRGLAQPTRLGREVTAWVSGAAGLPDVAPALEASTRDPERRVRLAAVWALGMLRDRDARPLLTALATSEDPTTRAFADEALARLDGAPW
jgi:HEAT repeat protein